MGGKFRSSEITALYCIAVAVVDSECCAGVPAGAPVDVDVDDAVVVVLSRILAGARGDKVVDAVVVVLVGAHVDVVVGVAVVILAHDFDGARVDVVVDVAADVLVIVTFVDPDVVAVETVHGLAERVKNRVENSRFPQCLVKTTGSYDERDVLDTAGQLLARIMSCNTLPRRGLRLAQTRSAQTIASHQHYCRLQVRW